MNRISTLLAATALSIGLVLLPTSNAAADDGLVADNQIICPLDVDVGDCHWPPRPGPHYPVPCVKIGGCNPDPCRDDFDPLGECPPRWEEPAL